MPDPNAKARLLKEAGFLFGPDNRLDAGISLFLHDEVHTAVLLHAGVTMLEAEGPILAVTRGSELD